LGLETCSEEHPCPIHTEIKEIKGRLVTMLETTLLSQLAYGVISGSSFLKY
jgi:Rrf2 family iron-sulfur cluster assembly transcriptional regulator